MIEIQATPDDHVGPIDRVVPRIGDRRERPRREPPFPPLPGEEEQEKPPAADESLPPSKNKETQEHRIDIHVLGLILPTRQLLPPHAHSRTLH